ncbi:type III secretion system protein [Cupriavidus sp. UYMSc13B]|nr:type III secretion system protein [Cupriavidus sp. UYMSc13B]
MADKTEKPTPNKSRDEARKGNTFISKDIITGIVLAVGSMTVSSMVDLRRVMVEFTSMVTSGAMPDPQAYIQRWSYVFLRMSIPFVLLCAIAGALPRLVQSRFTLAWEAIKLNLTALSPTNGFKKLFSWRIAKECVKALLYVVVSIATVWIFIDKSHRDLFQSFRADPHELGHLWIVLAVRIVVIFLVCSLPVMLLDGLVEYFLYFKSLKMDKSEVKKYHNDNVGNPRIKSKRRTLHRELLSDGLKSAIKQSNLVLANPIHIAIAIYYNQDIVTIPFVSVRETNSRALAVIRYAESNGVPVVHDIPLARSIYRNSRRYSFVSGSDFEAVMRVLIWLKEVEAANNGIEPSHDDAVDEDKRQESEEVDGVDASAVRSDFDPHKRRYDKGYR